MFGDWLRKIFQRPKKDDINKNIINPEDVILDEPDPLLQEVVAKCWNNKKIIFCKIVDGKIHYYEDET